MDKTAMLMVALATLGLLAGLLLGWIMAKSRTSALVQAATVEAKSATQVELATLNERLVSATAGLDGSRLELASVRFASDQYRAERDTTHQEVARVGAQLQSTGEMLVAERAQAQALNERFEKFRVELDESSNSIATLTERASRVDSLEVDLSAQTAALKAKDAQLRQLSAEHAQSTEKAAQLTEQSAGLRSALADTTSRLENALAEEKRLAQENSALEQQASRLPGSEQEVGKLRVLVATGEKELSELRESSTGQVSKLTAELTADRETLAALRQEHETQRAAATRQAERSGALSQELAELREMTTGEVSKLTAELASEKEALQLSRRDGEANKANATDLTARVLELTEELTGLRSKTDQERVGAEEKLQLLVQAKEELSQQFKVLATEILEEKSKRFSEQNNVSLGQLLDPLRTQLHEFKGRVDEVYVQEGKDRVALAEQVKQLMSLNQTLSQDANNLTQALKGQAKTQGNWGELILERVLEASGLRKGSEYVVQDSQRREDGTLAQPDVVITLPEERKLVVDAKVSLVAYERYMSAGTDADRQGAAKLHLESVRGHIRGLSDKRYNELYGIQSPDFVLAFVPVEPAFMLAVAQDNDLFMDAWSRNVLLVSPSTLLFVVRTVAHLWRQEHQTRNSQEIARRGALLYDKLSGFVTDLQKVGDRLNQAQAAFADANGKLTAGSGNVIRQAEMLRELGVKPTKVLPAAIIQAAGAEDIVLPILALDTGAPALQ